MEAGAAWEQLDQLEPSGMESELPDFMKFDETGETAPSMEVQAAEIRDVFLEMPELRYETWADCDLSERVEALNCFEEKIAEIAHRPPMEVRFEELEDRVMGYFDGKSLTISEQLAGGQSYEDYKEVMNTLFHEGRHAYQNYNLYGQQVEENSEMVEAWRVNNDVMGYDIAELGFNEYYTRPVEVDARVFAEAVVNELEL